MATFDDVLNTLVESIAVILLPLQTNPPANPAFKLYPGKPLAEQLQRDLAVGIVHVAVYGSDQSDAYMPAKITTYQKVTDPIVNLTAVVSTTKLFNPNPLLAPFGIITFGGSTNLGVQMIVTIGKFNVPYKPILAATLAQTATGLAAAINADADTSLIVLAVAVGAVVTVTALSVLAMGHSLAFGLQIGGQAQLANESARDKGNFQVTIFGYDNPSRVQYSNLIKGALALQQHIEFPDTSWGRLMYANTMQSDRELTHVVYRRTLSYTVQYTELAVTTGYQVLATAVQISGG